LITSAFAVEPKQLLGLRMGYPIHLHPVLLSRAIDLGFDATPQQKVSGAACH
jgi:hypothetical protein